MPGSILGTRVTRVEDPDLLMGRGSFVDDMRVEGLTSLAFVRSPIAHGRISGIDVSAARAHPGVLAVLTAADLGIAPYLGEAELAGRLGAARIDFKVTHRGY